MFSGTRDRVVHVTGIRRTQGPRPSRVEAEVDGTTVWFESGDVVLRPSSEAFGSAFLAPTLLLGRPLSLDAAADGVWLENVARLVRIFQKWWRTPAWPPRASANAAAPGPPVTRTALCFSAGVDSFHALLRPTEPIDTIVTVQGYDMSASDEPRMAALHETLRAVSAECGVRSIVVRTNLREHPLIRATPWERTHGGALAAIGHLLGDEFGRLLIASSIPYRSRREWWGSHWKTDALWSSASVAVANVGGERRRIEKLHGLAGEPIVQRHLRVCWENRDPSGNCSRCGKCLLAMLILADCGQLEHFPVFRERELLAQRVNALSSLKGMRLTLSDLTSSNRLPPELASAVRGLQQRTLHALSLPVRARRYVLGQVRSWTRGGRP